MFDGLLSSAAPLILASLGALISELGGALAIFMEGFISGGVFFSFLFADKLHSIFLSCVLVFFLCGFFAFIFARIVRATNANPFIASLSLNIFFEGIAAVFAQNFFGGKGTLKSNAVYAIGAIA